VKLQFVIFFIMHGQSTCEDSFHGDSERADTEGAFSRRDSGWRWSLSRARQSAEGEGAIQRRDSERIAIEYSHGDTASVQRMAREPFHVETAPFDAFRKKISFKLDNYSLGIFCIRSNTISMVEGLAARLSSVNLI